MISAKLHAPEDWLANERVWSLRRVVVCTSILATCLTEAAPDVAKMLMQVAEARWTVQKSLVRWCAMEVKSQLNPTLEV